MGKLTALQSFCLDAVTFYFFFYYQLLLLIYSIACNILQGLINGSSPRGQWKTEGIRACKKIDYV